MSTIYAPIGEHIFNDDLLSNERDLEHAEVQFPTVIHILDDSALRECFQHFNKLAMAAKAKGRRLGSLAIALGALAIILAAFEIELQNVLQSTQRGSTSIVVGWNWNNFWQWAIATTGAVCGIASVAIGKIGFLYGRRKEEWLQNRFMSERIRQFHFETFVARLPEIIASLQDEDEATRAANIERYRNQRSGWFAVFQDEINGKLGAVLNQTLETRKRHVWQHEKRDPQNFADLEELKPLFKAYRKFRIKHQLDYTANRLELSNNYLSSDKPRDHAAVLQGIGSWGIAALLFVHIFVLSSVIAYLAFSDRANFSSAFSPVSGPFNFIIILIATFALVARAFEQGLQPEREIERYRQYQSNIATILDRFDEARTQGELIGIMRDMEQVSFYEMCDFLITNNDSVFVM
jgi:hypothetical protein